MDLLAYINGDFFPESDAKVPIFDHGLLYGDGVFEGIRAYNRRVFKLDRHLQRLFNSAKAIHMEIPHTHDEMREIILELCRRNEIVDGYIRPIITRGPGDLGLDPRKCVRGPTVIVIARPFAPLYGDRYKEGLRLVTTAVRRNPPESLSPNIKSLNYLNNVLGRIEANLAGADEALMLDTSGFVSEATADNFFILKDGVVITPPRVTNLQGITRETVIEIVQEMGLEVREEFFTLYDVYGAEEAFISGTAAEVGPVVVVDDRTVGDGTPGKVTREIMVRFRDLVRSSGTPIYEKKG